MAYTINKSDGSVLISSLTDGTVNTTYSLQLFGRSYSGFGEGLNENLVRLLENSRLALVCDETENRDS